MALPLYLALTPAEFSAVSQLPACCAYMACHFSPYTEGLSNIPDVLPPESVLIVNDRLPCQGHSADLVSGQLADAVSRLNSESVLLDFQRPPDAESAAMVNKITARLSCPVAVTEAFCSVSDCPVFLSPAPLHLPLQEYLSPWKGREIWLEAALCQEEIHVTKDGTSCNPIFPTDKLSGGRYDETLHCCYRTQIVDNSIRFTLFDTSESLKKKLEQAGSLGVRKAFGLWQELGRPL